MTNNDCPFCQISKERVAFSKRLCIALWDGFPVTEGHLLLVPKRHVPVWADLSDDEKAELTEAIGEAQRFLRTRFALDGFNVGFNEGAAGGQTVPHFHIHIIPRRVGDVANPRGGVRHVIPAKADYLAGGRQPLSATPHSRALILGDEEDALIRHLLPHIDQSVSIDLVVSFILDSGVRLLQSRLEDLLGRGGRFRIVTGDYLDVTEPSALGASSTSKATSIIGCSRLTLPASIQNLGYSTLPTAAALRSSEVRTSLRLL